MKYYIYEASRNNGGSMTAGVKARCDVEDILEAEGYQRLTVLQAEHPTDTKANIMKASAEIARQWKDLTKPLQAGDVLAVQMPLSERTMELGPLIMALNRRGVKTVAVIHDLEKLRMMKFHNTIRAWKGHIRNFLEEGWALQKFFRIIVHNESMRAMMQSMGYAPEKLVSLDIFDYVIPKETSAQKVGDPEGVIIAGNLSPFKAGYVYKLPRDGRVIFSLYGVNYKGQEQTNVQYHGAFDPEVLPFAMTGKYGLVWDGSEADTCGGVHGEYLRINNPHKTSLYLAAGIPVIIWQEAALASFVRAQGVGICVSSLAQIPEAMATVSPEEYGRMKEKAFALSPKLRSGAFLKAALEKCGC